MNSAISFLMMLSVSMFFELENLEDQLLASFVATLFDCARAWGFSSKGFHPDVQSLFLLVHNFFDIRVSL